MYKTNLFQDTYHYQPRGAGQGGTSLTLPMSARTKAMRGKLASVLDEFTTFTWRGLHSFDSFGMFIINEGLQDLKFYNGPSFSNEYSSPQFSSGAAQLQGVKWSTQRIEFKVGVYWISIEDYRAMRQWLNPYEINILSFSFDTQFCYLVKLADCKDSTRYIVGYEQDKPRYYTEMTLSFDVQGDPVAFSQTSWDFVLDDTQKNTGSYLLTLNKNTPDFIETDLDTPFQLQAHVACAVNSQHSPENLEHRRIYLQGSLVCDDTEYPLFSGIISPQAWSQVPGLACSEDLLVDNNCYPRSGVSEFGWTFLYDSETGLLYLVKGNQKILISLTTTSVSGYRLFESFQLFSAMIPGRLTKGVANNIQFKLNVEELTYNINNNNYFIVREETTTDQIVYTNTDQTFMVVEDLKLIDLHLQNIDCEVFARTNVL